MIDATPKLTHEDFVAQAMAIAEASEDDATAIAKIAALVGPAADEAVKSAYEENSVCPYFVIGAIEFDVYSFCFPENE